MIPSQPKRCQSRTSSGQSPRLFHGIPLGVLLLVVVLLMGHTTPTTAKSSAPSSSTSNRKRHQPVVRWYESQPDLERAAYIRGILIQRLHHVGSGRRLRDICRWIQKHQQGEGAAIISIHGGGGGSSTTTKSLDLRFLEELHHTEHDRALLAEEVVSVKNPFSKNRMHLGLVTPPNAPPNQFPGPPQHELDDKALTPSVWQLGLRAIKLGFLFTPVMSTLGIAMVSPSFRQNIWYKWIASCMGNSGAAWIKWGQWSATRNDMFPDALCRELSTLHADAPAHDFDHSRTQIESSLGLAPNTLQHVFDSFDETPLASGSIAQVHRAQLNGKLLAVKVRHPNVAQLIDMDFRLMSLAARCFDVIPGLKWLRLRESIAQFSSTLAAQAHLHVEAYHLEVLNYNFRNFPSTRFPEPFFASSSIIIETFEPGIVFGKVLENLQDEADTLNEAKGLSSRSSSNPRVEEPDEDSTSNGANASDDGDSNLVTTSDLCPFPVSKFILTTGLNLYLKMLLVDNLMHADLHPGNIIYRLDREKGLATPSSTSRALAMINNWDECSKQSIGKMSITLVDAGMVAQLNDHESATFIGLLSSIGEGNGYEAAYFALQFSLENQRMTQEQESAFTGDMVELFAERCRGYGTNVDVGDVLRGVLGLVRKHQLRIDANFATLVVNVLCLESMARACLPHYNVLDGARPLLTSYRRLCYNADGTPKDPKVRRSKWVKFLLSVNYVKKIFLDKRLFEKARREQQANRTT